MFSELCSEIEGLQTKREREKGGNMRWAERGMLAAEKRKSCVGGIRGEGERSSFLIEINP